MKLFDKDHLTKPGLELDRELVNSLEPYFTKVKAEGGSVRELALLMHSAVQEAMCNAILDWTTENRSGNDVIGSRPNLKS